MIRKKCKSSGEGFVNTFKLVQAGSTPYRWKQSFEATFSSEKLAIQLISWMKTFEDVVHEIEVYSARVNPNGLALERFPDIKKNNNKKKKSKRISVIERIWNHYNQLRSILLYSSLTRANNTIIHF